MEHETYVCNECGSDCVYFDAWVGVNDREDVDIFSNTYCKNCSAECWIIEESEYKQEKE